MGLMLKKNESHEQYFTNCLGRPIWNSQQSYSSDVMNRLFTELSSVIKNYQVNDSPNFSKLANYYLQRNGFNNDV